jgi:hypothetical protein
LVLSIILPVGLLTGLKLSGIAPIATPETVTLAPVSWQFNRPTAKMEINQTLNATYADGSGRVSFRLTPIDYRMPEYCLELGVEFTATPLNRDFSMKSVLVHFGKDSQSSLIGFDTLVSFENLTLEALSPGEEATVQFLGNGSGVGCQFSAEAHWWLSTANNVTYERQVDFEVTYSNGTDYKTVVQPFNLTVQAVGYHYVFIGSILEGKMTSGVNVSVDGVEYSTPVSLTVKQGVHNITVARTIYVNGQEYAFDGWSDGCGTPTWSYPVNEDVGEQSAPLSAIYQVVTGGAGG